MSLQIIHYLADHDLTAILAPLKHDYKLLPLPAETAEPQLIAFDLTTLHGVVMALATRLSPKSQLLVDNPQACLILVGSDTEISNAPPEVIKAAHAFLPLNAPTVMVRQLVENTFRYLQAREVSEQARTRLEGQTQIMYELNRIGMALSVERNTERLLDMILRKAREMTRSDAASLYLVEPDGQGGEQLRFKYTQNETLEMLHDDTNFAEFTMPVSYQSIAGFVAESGIPLVIDDVYKIPIEAPYGFNRSFDEKSGYHTKSMLVVPMLNAANYVIGVLQLINHKIKPGSKIDSLEAADRFVNPYPQDLVDVATSLASQAAVALENSLLYQNIKKLFEGFVSASVVAIEQRDPTTSGHSFRVAKLTVSLAELVDRANEKPFSGIRFSRDQLTEIRYASLLHDFGKVGVREEVLIKAKKLYPMQFHLIQWRFEYYRKLIQQGFTDRKLNYLLEKGRDEYLAQLPNIDSELEQELKSVDEMWQLVMKSNEPTVLSEGSFEALTAVSQREFPIFDGTSIPLITEQERRTLSIPRGSLNEDERREIEQHAYHTFVFLSQIPWIEEWKNIPRIAGYHHEKLNGRGYPNHVDGKYIPIQSRMMTISDIFDALTASDRPYKKAVPVDKALNIIETEVKQGQLDHDLYDLFLNSKIYEIVLPKS